MRDWEPLCAGGESGYTAPDPLHPEILFGGTVEKCNVETGETKNVTPEVDLPRRRLATPGRSRSSSRRPIRSALYFANQFVYKTTDGGEHWARISDDLTREDPGVPPNLDAAAAADAPAVASAAASSTRSRRRRCARRSSGPAPTTATFTSRRTTARRGRT